MRSWLTALAIAVLAFGWILSDQSGNTADTGPGADNAGLAASAPDPATPPMVRVRRLTEDSMTNRLILTGQTKAARRLTLRAETQAPVAEILAAKGAVVQAGDPVLRLASEDRRATLAEADALVRQRQVEFEVAQSLTAQGHRARTELAAAEAALESARARRTAARMELSRLVIAAPFGGVIEDRMVELGDYVSRGDPVALLIDHDPIKVVGQVSERNLGQIETGTVGEVRLVDGRTVSGVISRVGTVADATTRTFEVELEIANPDRSIIEGTTAELHLPIAAVRGHRIPPSLLSLDDDGGLGVKAVDGDNRVRFLPVAIAGGGEDALWVTGLPAVVDAIVVGQEFVTTGIEVEPVAEVAAN